TPPIASNTLAKMTSGWVVKGRPYGLSGCRFYPQPAPRNLSSTFLRGKNTNRTLNAPASRSDRHRLISAVVRRQRVELVVSDARSGRPRASRRGRQDRRAIPSRRVRAAVRRPPGHPVLPAGNLDPSGAQRREERAALELAHCVPGIAADHG